MPRFSLLPLLVLAMFGQPIQASDVDYVRDVKPLLERCYACHGALRQQAGLRLDTAAFIRQGGDSGPAISLANASDSLVLDAITEAEFTSAMPPEGTASRLKPEEVAKIRLWITSGAAAPEEPIPRDPRAHWAFQPPVRPELPDVEGPWSRNPIDTFVAAKHREFNLHPLSRAEPHVLLRRVYLDLIGLPPTPEQLRNFLADPSDDAYQRVVNELLESPRHGERWGRHWLDVWRYSDWAGYRQEIRESQYHIWRWRDWVIESLNADQPYDQMIVEMLAADEANPTDVAALRATGYLGRSWYKFNRHVWLDDTVEHCAKAFLGLTVNCARCHEHKYDPIEQADYYRFRAFFEPHGVRYDPVSAETDTSKEGLARIYDEDAEAATYLFERGNDKQPDKDHPLAPGLSAFLAADMRIEPIDLPVEAFYPALRDEVVEARRAAAEAAVTAARKDASSSPETIRAAELHLRALRARLAAERAKYGLNPQADFDKLAAEASQAEREANAAEAEAAVVAGERELDAARAAEKPTAEIEKKITAAKKQRDDARAKLAETTNEYSPLGPVYPRTSTGRRLALAKWIASRENPLTARVAVNHIWMRHFGSPLVPTVFDFGNNGQPPTHPKLLDWLAVQLMEGDWRMKQLHRLIVTSNAYRLQSSTGRTDHPNSRIDPDNKYLWRANIRRLEAEAVRDSVLHVGGSLDLTMGGPEIDHAQGQLIPRRSIYFRHAKEKRMPFLEVFDGPGVTECYRRDETVVPQQALALANSPLAKAQSRQLSQRLSDLAKDDAGFIRHTFESVLSRPPTDAEQSQCLEFLTATRELLQRQNELTPAGAGDKASRAGSSDPAVRARENLVHVVLNHSDFVTIR